MPPSRARYSIVERTSISTALAAVFLFGASATAVAAERVISPQTAIFECGSVNPGDTLTLPSGTRGPLSIRNCKGTATGRIIIRNDPRGNGPVVIRRASGSSGGFILSCNGCVGVTIDGSYKWQGAPSGKTYGFRLTMTGGGAPTTFLKIAGLSRHVTIRNVEIDGRWPALAKGGNGIDVNDHAFNRNAYPGLWRENILIEDNYIRNVAKEGMYVGANYTDGDLPLRDIEIRNNRVEDVGFEGINTKSMWSGDNRIHHNQVRRAGKNGSFQSKDSQYSGIKNMAGTVKIYNNWVESTGQHGIQSWTQGGPKITEGKGPFEAQIWNNVVVNAGAFWRSFMTNSYGISVGAENGVEKPTPKIYNNTIVNSRWSAISVTSNVGSGFVRDNIAAGTFSNPVISVPRIVDLENNRIGSVSQMQFVDPGRQNYRLKTGSPARNEGTNNYPPTDHADVARPKEGAADQGAFEGNNN